jgi:elongation factor G
MNPKTLEKIRNVGIIAHIDAGKTTTTERILYYSGAIHRPGNVDEGTTTTDWYAEERARGITIFSTAVTCAWAGHTINLIDTPGHVDFTAEVERSLRVLDGAVGIFCGVGGVEAQSETVWRQAKRYHVPTLAYVNKLDRVGSDFERVVEEIRTKLGALTAPVTIPMGREAQFEGVLDLVRREAVRFDEADQGATVTRGPIPAPWREAAEGARARLLDVCANFDDALMQALLEETEAPAEAIHRALRAGTLSGKLTPVFAGSSLRNKGVQPLLDAVTAYLPSPLDVAGVEGTDPEKSTPVRRDVRKDKALTALAFKTDTDRFGELTYVRVYTGQIRAGETAYNPRARKTERLQRLFHLQADDRRPLDVASAGQIVGVAGLKFTHTGDTLCDPKTPIVLESMRFPETVISMSIEPKAAADRDKLLEVIGRLQKDDPTFRSFTDPETGQLVISGMGELHLEIKHHRIVRDFNVPANVGEMRVAYREAVQEAVRVEERALLRAGERELFGHVLIDVRPHPAALQPVVKVELDAEKKKLLARFLPSIEESLRGSTETGAIAGYPVVYTEVALVGGTVAEHSAEVAYAAAAARAMQKALAEARAWVLEPHMRLEVTVPEEFFGPVAADLTRRHADITHVESHEGFKTIKGTVALSQMLGYSTAVRSLTQGRASYTLEPADYRPLPPEEFKARFGGR